jgi:hypothetical protein
MLADEDEQMNRVVIRDSALARELETLTSCYQESLIAILRKARGTETTGDHHASALAVGEVLAAIGSSVLFPIYRMHPALTPEALKECVERDREKQNNDQDKT